MKRLLSRQWCILGLYQKPGVPWLVTLLDEQMPFLEDDNYFCMIEQICAEHYILGIKRW